MRTFGHLQAILLSFAVSGLMQQASGQAVTESFDVDQLVADPARLVFAEDFTDEASLDRFVFASPEHWRRVRVGDRYALEHLDAGNAYQPPHRSPHNIALIDGRKFGSFVAEFDAQQTGREYGHRDACFFFNFVDRAHFYYVHIATHRDPHAHNIFTVNAAPRTKITAWGTDGFDWETPESWHRVRVVRDLATGRIEVYVDDMSRPIMRAEDRTHGVGQIGFGSFDDTGRVANIRIYAPDSHPRQPRNAFPE